MSMIRFGEFDDMFGRMDRMMNNMMNSMFGRDPFAMHDMMTPFAMPSFARMNSLMSSHDSMFGYGQPMLNNMNTDSGYYCSSSMMTVSTDASGRPLVYEQTSSTRGCPGGVRETRNTVRDSASGLQKMSVGHHIRERGHVLERSRNHYTGDEEQNEEFLNIEETEAQQFNREWQTRMQTYNGYGHQRGIQSLADHERQTRPQPQQLALPAPNAAHETSQRQTPNETHRNRGILNKMPFKKQKEKKSKKPYKKN